MDNDKKQHEKHCKKFGLFIKVNFINSFNKFKNDKETEKKINHEIQGD